MPVEPLYEVVSPVGHEAEEKPGSGRSAGNIFPAAPLADLNGKKIGLIWTLFTNGNVLLEALGDLLAERYHGLEFVKLPPGRNLNWGDYPDRSLGAFARENGLDAAIVSVGC